MTGGHVIAAGMENEGFAFLIFVLFHFTNKNDVIAAIVLPDFAADKLGDDAAQKRHSGGAFFKVNSGKLIGEWRRELPGKMVLMSLQYVDRKVRRVRKISEAGRLPCQAPEDERWIQGNGRKGIDGHANFAAVGPTGGHDRHASRKLSESFPVISPVETFGDGLGLFLHELLGFRRVHEPREQGPRIVEAVDECTGHG